MPRNILFVLSNICLSSFSSFLLYYFASTVGLIFVHLVGKSLFGFSTILMQDGLLRSSLDWGMAAYLFLTFFLNCRPSLRRAKVLSNAISEHSTTWHRTLPARSRRSLREQPQKARLILSIWRLTKNLGICFWEAKTWYTLHGSSWEEEDETSLCFRSYGSQS